MENDIIALIEELEYIQEDDSIPKNVRTKVGNAILALKEDKEPNIKANKALRELDDLSEDPNVPLYIRPQIWNVVSRLAKI